MIMKIVILHDYVPDDALPDQVDNLVQAREIGAALTGLGHEVRKVMYAEPVRETATELVRLKPDLVFNLVETVQGSGRWIHQAPELLEILDLPYTGSPAEAVRLTTDKLTAKRIFSEAGLPTPAWATLADEVVIGPDSERFIIKSVWEHASLGLDRDSVLPFDDVEGLRRGMRDKKRQVRGRVFRRGIHRRSGIQPVDFERSRRAGGAASGRNRV